MFWNKQDFFPYIRYYVENMVLINAISGDENYI